MELFIHDPVRQSWSRAAGVLPALQAAVAASLRVAIQTADPEADIGELLAATWFFKSAGGSPEHLTVICPAPAAAWISALFAAGVARVFVAALTPAAGFSLAEALPVPRDVCPDLHLRRSGRLTVSVCGCSADRQVLVRRHFAAQCFGHWTACAARRRRGATEGCAAGRERRPANGG